jgi:hypothetical protein
MKLQLRELPDRKPTPAPDWRRELAYLLTESKANELRRKRPDLTPEQAFDQALTEMDPDTQRALAGGRER